MKPWEQQKKEKYRDHDLVVEDIKDRDFISIKGHAIKAFVDTKESDQTKLIVTAFLGFLTSNGYRITKKES